MSGFRRLNQPKCECGKKVSDGSVFCLCCKAIIIRKNLKVLSREKMLPIRKA